MRTSLIMGVLVAAMATIQASAWAADGRGGGPRMRGGGGSGGGAQPTTSIPNQFFGQAAAQQQSFFSQSVFPQSNFVVTPMFQPGLTGSVYISPPTSNILPPLFVASYQPGFYVASTVYSVGGAYTSQATIVYSTPQSVNSYYSGPTIQPRIGLIGRW